MTKSRKSSVNLATDFAPDDNGNAECMLYFYNEELIYCDAYKWMHYTGTHWKRISDSIAYRFAIDTLRRRMQSANDQGLSDLQRKFIQDETKITKCVQIYKRLADIGKPDIFDKDSDLLNCLNGVVNLRTGSLEQHKPCQYFTYCVPAEYKPDADKSLIEDFVHNSTGSEGLTHFLQKLVGYSLTGHTREEKLIYLHGPTRSGKGTLTETLKHLLGSPLAAATGFDTFTVQRTQDTQNFDLAPLKPARFILASESNTYEKLNSAKVKQATGGDSISCAFKYGDRFDYRPQFKIWLVSNHPVNGDPGDDALWSRILVVEFPFSHLGEEDMTLKDKFRRPENLEGVLRWAVEGAMRWYAEGLGTPPREVTEVTNKHRDAQDYVKLWLNDEPCIKDNKGEIERFLFEEVDWESSADLTKSFKQWCNENSVKSVPPPNQFAISLKRLGFTPKMKKPNNTRGYIIGSREQQGAADSQDSAQENELGKLRQSAAPGAPVLPPPDEKPQQNGHDPKLYEFLDMLNGQNLDLAPTPDVWFKIVAENRVMPPQEELDQFTDFLADYKEEMWHLLMQRQVK